MALKFKLRRKSLAVCCTVLLSVGLTILIPAFLLVEDMPKKAQAVILFVGPTYDLRYREVVTLINEGKAEFILTPAFGNAVHPESTYQWNNLAGPESDGICHKRLFGSIRLCENTHREMLRARSMMEALGLKSAILVSSPYHMRRIKIIANRVFGAEEYRLGFKPTRYENAAMPWFASLKGVKWVTAEYCKILWFFCYSPFT